MELLLTLLTMNLVHVSKLILLKIWLLAAVALVAQVAVAKSKRLQ
jgi:hypothetical protein